MVAAPADLRHYMVSERYTFEPIVFIVAVTPPYPLRLNEHMLDIGAVFLYYVSVRIAAEKVDDIAADTLSGHLDAVFLAAPEIDYAIRQNFITATVDIYKLRAAAKIYQSVGLARLLVERIRTSVVYIQLDQNELVDDQIVDCAHLPRQYRDGDTADIDIIHYNY